MPTSCVVPGCKSASKTRSHSFPKNSVRSREWQLAINSPRLRQLSREDMRNFHVCCLHFPANSYTSGPKGRLMLKRNAIPSLNLTASSNTQIEHQRHNKNKNNEQEATDVLNSSSQQQTCNDSRVKASQDRRFASCSQHLKDALKLVNTKYFQDLMSSRSRSDKLYAELQRYKSMHTPSVELMELCRHVIKTCPEYAHEYITNMLIKKL